MGVHRDDAWYLDSDGSGSWNVPGDEYFRFGIAGDQPVVGRWQSDGGGGSQVGGDQASFASVSPALPAEAELSLKAGRSQTDTSAAGRITEVDHIFAAEPAMLPAASESDMELSVDSVSGQVTRSSRLGSGGLLDLPSAKAHDQALEGLLQSACWM